MKRMSSCWQRCRTFSGACHTRRRQPRLLAPEPLESGHGVWLKPSHAARGLLDCGYASSAGYCFKEGLPAAMYGLAVLDLLQVLWAEAWEAIQMLRRAQGSLQGGAKTAEPTTPDQQTCSRLEGGVVKDVEG